MNKSPNISQVLTSATATVMAAASTTAKNFTKASTFYVLSQDQPPAKIRYALHIENEIIFVYPFVVAACNEMCQRILDFDQTPSISRILRRVHIM